MKEAGNLNQTVIQRPAEACVQVAVGRCAHQIPTDYANTCHGP